MLLARAALREYGPVELVSLDDLAPDSWLAPAAGLGAPQVLLEKLPGIEQAASAPQALAAAAGRELTHVTCVEIGGVNSLIPIAAAARTGLPLVDADMVGRAFPEVQMTLPALRGINADRMALVDEKGNRAVLHAVDNRWMERLARGITVTFGSMALGSTYAMTGLEAKESMVAGSLSLCFDLSRCVTAARAGKNDPVDAVTARLAGQRLFDGRVTEVLRRTEGGFTRGEARLTGVGQDTGTSLTLRFQNEYLIADREGSVLATVPDLICTLDPDTGEAVTVETLRFGRRLSVIVAPADPRWHTSEGIALAGPRYFGYDLDPVRAPRVCDRS
ncbi:DUF917 domain-containing protein [Streptomyces sp. AC512_CC834]|uniref:DUF917 domain-containing protein n=1 Tax=Streptomyces sp. AC512_CC834 TaxID=2823691 RepID=UPI0020B8B22E|nr:DUF917 domain-containing protein [Streptomyces sp. AC512_CC834]